MCRQQIQRHTLDTLQDGMVELTQEVNNTTTQDIHNVTSLASTEGNLQQLVNEVGKACTM